MLGVIGSAGSLEKSSDLLTLNTWGMFTSLESDGNKCGGCIMEQRRHMGGICTWWAGEARAPKVTDLLNGGKLSLGWMSHFDFFNIHQAPVRPGVELAAGCWLPESGKHRPQSKD